jgi:ABC-type glycerol-3-phosphate transport system permease component
MYTKRSAKVMHFIGIYGVFALLAFVFLIPFLWTIGSSFRLHSEIFQYSYPLTWRTFIPVRWTLDNYYAILVERGFLRFLFNSLFVAIVMVIISWFINSMGAYAFSRGKFRGKEYWYLLVLATMLMPLEASIIPTYMIVKDIGLYDSLWALIIPWVVEPFGIFLLRQFIDAIPRDLDDAASIDGCDFWQIYAHVMMPNIRPALITLALMKFIWAWGAFFWPLVITESKGKMVIQLALATLTTKEVTYWGQTFAAVILSVLPVILIFAFLQRYYVEGITMSGIKD